MNEPRARAGVFGGTFNPIHLGHLRAAEEAAEALDLERVVFVPSARPPHKDPSAEVLAPVADRLAWVRLATAGNPRFEVDPIEVEREGPSWLVETLPVLRERLGPLWFLLGRDAFAEMPTWREPRRLLELAHFAVLSRPPVPGEGAGLGDAGDWVPPELASKVRLVEITALDISASDVRARLRKGLSVRYLLPDAVHDAVVASGAYGARS